MLDATLIFARFVLGTVLIVAAMAKLRAGHATFLRRVYAYDLLPSRAAWLLARLLPSVEMTVAVFLLVGLWTSLAAAATVVLLAAFTAAIGLSLLRGQTQPCGCSEDVTPVRWRLVGRNLVLSLVAVALAVHGGGQISADATLTAGPFEPLIVPANLFTALLLIRFGMLERRRLIATTTHLEGESHV